VRAIRAALPTLARDGSIVALSGYLCRKPSAGYSAFAAVNGAIEALVKVLAIELAPVRVNALVPGQVDTLRDIIGEEANRGRNEAAAAKLPVGRIGTPDDLAHAALFLLENRFSTGTALDVDGGER
jgi:NAD(P)-dependent dehydrogenase (short-subunit alcohol dehydrogenase family)